MTSSHLFDNLAAAVRHSLTVDNMLRFSVPCLFFGKHKTDFDIYVGAPNKDYDAITFQAEWLKRCRKSDVDKQFRQRLKELRRIASKSKTDFETLCSQAVKIGEPARSESEQLTQSKQKILDLTKALKERASSAAQSAQKPQSKTRVNPLLRYWSSEVREGREHYSAKDRVIADVTKTILRAAANPSSGCRYLLPFLLSYEGMSLTGVLREKIESQQVKDLTYGLVVMADTEGRFISCEALDGFRKFMNKQQGDQLLAMVELRNILEHWAMSSESGTDSPYDLTELRRDLREYFLPQQWKGKKKATPQNMYRFAQELHVQSDSKDTRVFLGVLAWLLRAAVAGESSAEASLGYFFAECGDFGRYLYWTKKSAAHGSAQALFNLGESYATGENGGVQKNVAKALKYFLKADRLGFTLAMSEIGHCYMKLRNYKKAKVWLDKAVSMGGNQYAYYHLGELYEKGLDVPKSKASALGHYVLAGDMGLEVAQKAAVRLRGKPVIFST